MLVNAVVGDNVGLTVGDKDGTSVGCLLGVEVGTSVCRSIDGLVLGEPVIFAVGEFDEGSSVKLCVVIFPSCNNDGATDGLAVGAIVIIGEGVD